MVSGFTFKLSCAFSPHEEGSKFYQVWHFERIDYAGRSDRNAVVTQWGKTKYGRSFTSGKHKIHGRSEYRALGSIILDKGRRGYNDWKTDDEKFENFDSLVTRLKLAGFDTESIRTIADLLGLPKPAEGEIAATTVHVSTAETTASKPAKAAEPLHVDWGSW